MRGQNVEAIAWAVHPNGDFVVYILKSAVNGVHPVMVRRDRIGPDGEWRHGDWLVAAAAWTRTPAEWEAYHRGRQRGTAFVPSTATYLQILQEIDARRAQVTPFCRAAANRHRARYLGASGETYRNLTDDL